MLYIVGLGLGDERDITVRGLDAVRSCSKIYMEAYTSLLSLGLDPAALANLVRLPSLVRPPPVRANARVARSELLLLIGVFTLSCFVRPGEAVREGDNGRRPGDG
jgi:hypothetical protein